MITFQNQSEFENAVCQALQSCIHVKVEIGQYGGENMRYITVMWGDREVTSFSIDIKDRPEYEG